MKKKETQGFCLQPDELKRSIRHMVAYEFYWLHLNGYQLIGVLPERRKNLARITQRSIMNWVGELFGETLDIGDIFFIRITRDKHTGRFFRPIPFFMIQENT